MLKCKNCGKELQSSKKMFCNSSCAATFNNRNRTYRPGKDKATKTLKCSNCGVPINVNLRASTGKCETCRIEEKKCKVCGQLICKKREICKQVTLIKGTLHRYFGFNIDTLGSQNVYKEYDRIRSKIQDLYYNFSINELAAEVCYPFGGSNLWNLLRQLKLDYRSFSDSQKFYIKKHGSYKAKKESKSKYKCGWHTTWDGKNVYYRSSYELEFMEQLDLDRKEYEVESLRIEYWDEEKCEYRIAIPDFYLPSENLIIEIKSIYFLRKNNLLNKIQEFYKKGYNFKLILDKKDLGMNSDLEALL